MDRLNPPDRRAVFLVRRSARATASASMAASRESPTRATHGRRRALTAVGDGIVLPSTAPAWSWLSWSWLSWSWLSWSWLSWSWLSWSWLSWSWLSWSWLSWSLLSCLLATPVASCVNGERRIAAVDAARDLASGPSSPVAENDVRVRRPLDGPPGSLVAVVFISHECPIANAMMPALRELSEHAQRCGVAFHLVHAASWVTAAEVETHAREFGIAPGVSVLVDPAHDLVARAGATVTPEAVLFRRDGRGGGEILYLGRVNDLYVAVGRRRPAVASHDLRDAIDSASAGSKSAGPHPKAVGCFIEPIPDHTDRAR